MRRLGFAILYCLYIAAFAAVVDYLLFWRPFAAELRRSSPEPPVRPRHVDEETMKRIGSLRADRSSAFAHFERRKPAGRLRLCAFGDSFTYGDEVADGHDYPALLQGIFQERSVGNVEVLNFGNPWYGFHQAYLLWEGVGRDFGCDVVLLGPDCFQPERDTTFNHTALAFPYYLHARYVLEGEGVRRVDVLGDTPAERFSGYFGFFPRWPYLRFDRNAPAFLQATQSAGRVLINPFYYYAGDAVTEAHATYARLLAELARERVTVLLLHALPPIVELANRIDAPNLLGVHAPRTERFPYSAPGGHYSAFGNRWVAEQYFALLTDARRTPIMLDFEDVATPRADAASRGPAKAPPISSYDRIYSKLGDRRAGFLAIASANPGARGGSAEDLAGSGAVGLLALEPEGASVLDAAFIETPVAPRDGDPVVLRSAPGEDVHIATVRVLDPRANLGVATVAGLELAGALTLRIGSGHALPADASVLMGTTPIARATADGARLQLEPVVGALRNMRVGAAEYAPVGALANVGAVKLVLEGAAGNLEVALARWRTRTGDVFATERRLGAHIVERNGRAALVLTPAP